MPVHCQHQVADVPAHGGGAQVGGFAESAGQLHQILVLPIAEAQLPGQHRDDQLRPLAVAVIEGAQLSLHPELALIVRAQGRQLLLTYHDVDYVPVAGEPLHLQREDVKLLGAAGMGIDRSAAHIAAEPGEVVIAYHVHGSCRPFR